MSRPSPRSLALALVVLAAACGSIPPSEVEAPQGRQFIPMVPDSIDDVGLAPSVAVDAEGLPTISYFGFPAQLEEGEIPIARPVGSPFLTTEDGDDAGAVLLVSLTPEQIWNRGAIAQPRDTPSGVPVPFEPAAELSLASLTKARAAGTDVATADKVHAVWTTDKGVWYGIGPSPFEIGAVEETPEAGAPSVVVDGAGEPIVAYTIAGLQPEVRVAERVGENWRVTTVATLSRCGAGCPPATQLALVGGEPLVVTADPLSGDVIAARRQGGTWTTEVVATDATGGASVATSGDRAAIAYYTRTGVALATGRAGSWSVEEVASLASGEGDPSAVPTPPSTGVAVDRQGTVWAAWQGGDGIHLASQAEGTFEEVELPDTSSGVNPSLAVTEDGSSVYLAWYDADESDLRLGTYSEISDLKIAAPSPAPSPAPAGPPEDCGDDGEPVLEVTAPATSFTPTCLVAPAEEEFTITFNNEDEGVTHNLAILTEADEVVEATDLKPGTYTDELPVGPQEEGDLQFLCQAHPDQMFGTLAIVAGSGGGGGNGGGGNGGGGGGG